MGKKKKKNKCGTPSDVRELLVKLPQNSGDRSIGELLSQIAENQLAILNVLHRIAGDESSENQESSQDDELAAAYEDARRRAYGKGERPSDAELMRRAKLSLAVRARHAANHK